MYDMSLTKMDQNYIQIQKKLNQISPFRGILGCYQRFRWFIPAFVNLSSPLSDLLKKGNIFFYWTEEANEDFLKLRSVLIPAPVLVKLDFIKPFVIHTDAIKTAIGRIFVQDWEIKSEERIIAYFMRKLYTSSENIKRGSCGS